MKPTRNALRLTMLALCLCGAGCTVTNYTEAARPVSAELQIYTVDPKTGERKWMTNQRTVYTYREDE